jgi:hypothetical protein
MPCQLTCIAALPRLDFFFSARCKQSFISLGSRRKAKPSCDDAEGQAYSTVPSLPTVLDVARPRNLLLPSTKVPPRTGQESEATCVCVNEGQRKRNDKLIACTLHVIH